MIISNLDYVKIDARLALMWVENQYNNLGR